MRPNASVNFKQLTPVNVKGRCLIETVPSKKIAIRYGQVDKFGLYLFFPEKKKSQTKSPKIGKKKDSGNFPISQMFFAERKWKKIKFS